MDLLLQRETSANGWTLGHLSIDGAPQCFICEDEVREVEGKPVGEWKIPHKTAIPRGKYKVIVSYSNRFKRLLPLLLAVPGFDGIRIHPGNTAEDTEGCLLPGQTHDAHGVYSSRAAFDGLYPLLDKAFSNKESIWIEVR